MIDLRERLSANFTIGEWLSSQTAERDRELKAIQYSPPEDALEAARHTFRKTIQPARSYFGVPITVSSGYRCPELNQRIGGSPTSQHVVGEAADLHLSSTVIYKPECTMQKIYLQRQVETLLGEKNSVDWSQANADFYLFLYFALRRESLDIDQVIHEWGECHGQPAWVHVASSLRQDRRRVTYVGSYTGRAYLDFSVEEAFREWPLKEAA